MRVMHIMASNFVGGPERQVLRHLEHLSAEPGWQICLVSFAEPGGEELLERGRALGAEVWRLPAARRQLFRARGLLAQQIARWQPDVVCTHGYKPLALSLTVRSSPPRIAFSRGWTREDWRIRLYTLLDKFLLRFPDRVVAVAESQRQRLRRIRVPAHKIRVIANACTLDEAPCRTPGDDVRRAMGLPARGPLLLAAGRLSPEKGHRHLLAAMPAILKAHPSAQLLIAGDGPLREELLSGVGGALRAHVHLPGFCREVHGLFRAADLLVLPSLSEGMPNVLLEAMALELPVVATRVGGVPELLQNGRLGVLVEPASPAALAEACIAALDHPQSCRERAAEARIQVLRTHGSKRQTEKLQALYREVVEWRSRMLTV
ncbi:glycosyltransferase [Alkalilimnicola sp. S0819]|uniref:glycosyltransferase n=1 Tax=Alkalilimnicola sp. S0819 TaxID=2613922 RepID=UPI0012614CE2|nr:glycosyltransferase [Alkalilimnicola sp. S0819]KAB7622854.1 glycosyltransferase [Alkalilimnicola sp. S0819]MPQ17176.1 glycosyltransferase [Alkalilimnicola sp. S0819]